MEKQFLSNKQHTNTNEALREFILPFYKSVTLTIHVQALLCFHNISRGVQTIREVLGILVILRKIRLNIFFHQNKCYFNMCYNNTTCLVGFTDKGYKCVCPAGYTGEHCGEGMASVHSNDHVYFHMYASFLYQFQSCCLMSSKDSCLVLFREMTFPMNFKGALCHKISRGFDVEFHWSAA